MFPFAVLGAFCLFGDLSFWDVKMPALITGEGTSFSEYFAFTKTDLSDELAMVGLTVSLLFIAFAKERDEDECIAQIRGNSLTWAVIVDCIVLGLGTLLIYDFAYFSFLCILQFLTLILFIIKFRIALFQFRRTKYAE